MDTSKIKLPYLLADVYKASEKNLFKVVSTFAGGGGSSTGYRLAGGNILAINEFVKKAQECYSRNYPNTFIFKQDIRKLSGKRILKKLNLKVGELDILDGSPPCSGFSTAGLREKGWGEIIKYSDTEQVVDDLFFEFARLVKSLQPKVFIAENVKGLTVGPAKSKLGVSQIAIFETKEKTIIDELKKCGYNVKYKILNAMYYSVPQSRERLIIIGVRTDIKHIITFPKKQFPISSVEQAFENLINDSVTNCLNNKNTMIYDLWKNVKPGETFEKAHKAKFKKKGNFSRQKIDKNLPCKTLTTHESDLQHYSENRKLTIPEAIRIQTFPDDYYLGETYSKQYERLGRAVSPLMMKAIAEHVYKTILKPYYNENRQK